MILLSLIIYLYYGTTSGVEFILVYYGPYFVIRNSGLDPDNTSRGAQTRSRHLPFQVTWIRRKLLWTVYREELKRGTVQVVLNFL